LCGRTQVSAAASCFPQVCDVVTRYLAGGTTFALVLGGSLLL